MASESDMELARVGLPASGLIGRARPAADRPLPALVPLAGLAAVLAAVLLAPAVVPVVAPARAARCPPLYFLPHQTKLGDVG